MEERLNIRFSDPKAQARYERKQKKWRKRLQAGIEAAVQYSADYWENRRDKSLIGSPST